MNRKLTWLLAAACLLAAVLAQAGGKQEGSAGGGKPVTLRYSTWDYADRRDSTDAFIQGALETLNIKIELEKGFRAMLAGATTVDKLTATVQAMVAEKLAKK
jgi:ABC-type proline/glycine betaine transport system substrate-binding protein